MRARSIHVPETLTAKDLGSDYVDLAGAILLVLAAVAVFYVLGPLYGLVGFALLWAPYVFSRPTAGLWFSPTLIMISSLVAPPAGFEFGVGYSPELPYWAIATCVIFAPLLLRYLWAKSESGAASNAEIAPPRALYAFLAVSIGAAILGLARGYAFLNVAKQFYGCILFCGYFLFALRFAPTEKETHFVVDRVKNWGILCSVAYLTIYLSQIPALGLRKELTILSAYAGGLAVLSLPQFLHVKPGARRFFVLLALLTLFAVPFLARYKRAVFAFFISVFLAITLRSSSGKKRYFYLALAFFVFTVAFLTSLLNPIGEFASQSEMLSGLFPGDVQESYSVFLRLEQLRQVLDSLGGPPLFGTGLGSTISWYDPYAHTYGEQEIVDIGWGYLLVKLGIGGTLVFIWLMGTLGVHALRKPLQGLHLGLFLLLVFHLVQMVADTFFVHFMTAAWAGTTCGFLHNLNRRAPDIGRVRN